MRAVLMFITIAALAAMIIFAPQGLMTKPHYSESSIGPAQLLYTTLPEGQSADSVRSKMAQKLGSTAEHLGVPVLVQPSLAAARGEEETPFLTGFLLDEEVDSTAIATLPFMVAVVDSQPAMRAEFPYRGFLSLPLGNWKINERVRKRAADRDWQQDQLILLLDRDKETLVYLVPETAVQF